jgi:hypothetical protein
MIEERKPLPESVGGLFDTAFSTYGRRFGLYAIVAIAGFAVQGIAALLFTAFGVHEKNALVLSESIVGIFVDAFILGVVSIGVIADVSGVQTDTSTILASTIDRWLSLIGVNALINLIMIVPQVSVLASGVVSVFVFVLPVAALSGAIAFATVACAVDTSVPGLRIIGSFAQSIRLALAPPNFGRTVLIGIATLVPLLLQSVLSDQMGLRHVRGADFWANVPLDAIIVGPLQAIFAVFYLDFIRRLKAAEANR